MCGIIGYIGPKDVVHVLIDGLRRLEYRGYDSAGVAVVHDGAVTLRGPVKSDEERKKIGAMAEQVAGAGRVQNHLEVAPPK